MPKLISINSSGGGTLVVAAQTPEGYIQAVGAADVVEKLGVSLDNVFQFAITAASQFSDVAKQAGAKSSEIEFGVAFTAKGTVFVCETTAEATIKMKFVF